MQHYLLWLQAAFEGVNQRKTISIFVFSINDRTLVTLFTTKSVLTKNIQKRYKLRVSQFGKKKTDKLLIQKKSLILQLLNK